MKDREREEWERVAQTALQSQEDPARPRAVLEPKSAIRGVPMLSGIGGSTPQELWLLHNHSKDMWGALVSECSLWPEVCEALSTGHQKDILDKPRLTATVFPSRAYCVGVPFNRFIESAPSTFQALKRAFPHLILSPAL